MKRLYLLTALAFMLIGINTSVCNCGHVLTDECGLNGNNCTHVCYQILPIENEHLPY